MNNNWRPRRQDTSDLRHTEWCHRYLFTSSRRYAISPRDMSIQYIQHRCTIFFYAHYLALRWPLPTVHFIYLVHIWLEYHNWEVPRIKLCTFTTFVFLTLQERVVLRTNTCYPRYPSIRSASRSSKSKSRDSLPHIMSASSKLTLLTIFFSFYCAETNLTKLLWLIWLLVYAALQNISLVRRLPASWPKKHGQIPSEPHDHPQAAAGPLLYIDYNIWFLPDDTRDHAVAANPYAKTTP